MHLYGTAQIEPTNDGILPVDEMMGTLMQPGSEFLGRGIAMYFVKVVRLQFTTYSLRQGFRVIMRSPMLRHVSRDRDHNRHSPGICHETRRKAELPTHLRQIGKRESNRCVRLAALPGVRPSLHDPMGYELTNVMGTIRLLEHARKMGTPHFVFASSSSVYGPDTPLPAVETSAPDPCSPYALTKLHGEQWGRLYSRLHGLRFLALRFFSVWDPGNVPI
jgi:nucleoside-diphosphate-sugar epimerase